MDAPLKHYCVKLGELCPQLKNLAVVDTDKLLAKGGLLINIKLLDSAYCMSGYLLEAVSAEAGVLNKLELDARADYTIDNIYLGVVQHMDAPYLNLGSMTPMDTPFKTFYQFAETIQGSAYNRLFAIP